MKKFDNENEIPCKSAPIGATHFINRDTVHDSGHWSKILYMAKEKKVY